MSEYSRRVSEQLIARNQDLIDKFLEITERKVSVLDDYGDENWGVLPNEIIVCLRKIGEREGLSFNFEEYARAKRRGGSSSFYFSRGRLRRLPEEYQWLEKKLEEKFREFHEKAKSRLGTLVCSA